MTNDVTGGGEGGGGMVAHIFFILFCSMFRQAHSNQAHSGDYFANQTRPKTNMEKEFLNESKLSKLSIVGRIIGDSHR